MPTRENPIINAMETIEKNHAGSVQRWGREWLQQLALWSTPGDPHVSEYERWRARNFTIVMLAMMTIQAVLLLLLFWEEVAPFSSEMRQLVQGVIAKILTGQSLALLAFHSTRSLPLAVQIANLGIYIAMIGAAFSLGGPSSPTLPVLVLVPLFAALFSGSRWGISWTGICIGTVVGLHVIEGSGFEFINIMKPENSVGINSGVLCLIYLATGVVVFFYEVLNRRLRKTLARERAKFVYHADHDSLTGLKNRRRHTQELDQAFSRVSRVKQGLALIAVDLDDLKPVNDELGHAAGDAVLQLVAERLRGSLRITDSVARVGGDEFAILLEHVDSWVDIEVVIGKIQDAMRAPFMVEGREIEMRASLGAALYPDDGTTPDALWHSADQAMYTVKREHKKSL
ncbi:MAG: GGDEF domain-containing protein [Deltaproteobacteria bacterium]|nr:GGDEF domain-containing protein [Deltaproteobacteria bacterium]